MVSTSTSHCAPIQFENVNITIRAGGSETDSGKTRKETNKQETKGKTEKRKNKEKRRAKKKEKREKKLEKKSALEKKIKDRRN